MPFSEYERLKSKYAGNLVANWSETSDPEKSVHEAWNFRFSLRIVWFGKIEIAN